MQNGIGIQDYYKFKFLKAYDISPDGKRVVYSLATFNKNEEKKVDDDDEFHHKELVNLWLLDLETNQTNQITFGDNDRNPTFSPNGDKIVFSSKREDKPQLFILPLSFGEAKQITKFENGVLNKVDWIDNDTIIFTALKDEKLINVKQPYRFTRDFYRMDAMGNVDNLLQDIFIINLRSGETKQLSEDSLNYVSINLSPDKSKALMMTMFEENRKDGIYPHLRIIDLETGEITKLSNYYCFSATWKDNTTIFFSGRSPEEKIGSNSNIFEIDIKTNELKNLTADDFYGFGGGLQADMPTQEARILNLEFYQGKVYGNSQIGGNFVIRSVDIATNDVEEVVSGERANYLYKIIGENIFYASSNPKNPIDIFKYNITTRKDDRLTELNKEFLNSKDLGISNQISFTSVDGVEVEGWLVTPSPLDQVENLPTLLNIHGGPHAGWGNVFQFEVQYLCNAGYAILMINHRASTGYGEEFCTKIIGDWGNLDYKDLMAGVDYVIERGFSDPEKLGCFGISGGGNLSSWIVGQTNRFKAAIPENPVTNWNSFFGTSDIGRWFAEEEMGGLPWEIPEVYRKASPVTYAHNCMTPTLLIQHENDLRCPAEQSDQFYAILKEIGCEVEMLRMPGTPHGGSILGPLEVRENQNLAILNWFEDHI